MTNTIAWFRRDLRVTDNHVLQDAIAAAREAGGGVIPLFVVDPALWDTSGPNRTWFLAGCLAALDRALQQAEPEVFNSDQGAQFTSLMFTERLTERRIKISMDGRGRALDNIFVERLWRSVKYEEVYVKEYRTVPDAIMGLGGYFEFYNRERLHQSLGYKTPEAVYRHGLNPAAKTTLT